MSILRFDTHPKRLTYTSWLYYSLTPTNTLKNPPTKPPQAAILKKNYISLEIGIIAQLGVQHEKTFGNRILHENWTFGLKKHEPYWNFVKLLLQ